MTRGNIRFCRLFRTTLTKTEATRPSRIANLAPDDFRERPRRNAKGQAPSKAPGEAARIFPEILPSARARRK
jgi:hypothetical protein